MPESPDAASPAVVQEPESDVCVTADWRGDLGYALECIHVLKSVETRTLLHLGSLFVGDERRDARFLRKLEQALAKAKIRMLVTDPNRSRATRTTTVRADDGPRWLTPHVGVVPRPYRMIVGHTSFLFVGNHGHTEGADPMDGTSPQGGRLSDDDLERAIDGGPVDVLISDHPSTYTSTAINEQAEANPDGHSFEDLAVLAADRERLATLVELVTPKLHIHTGHQSSARTVVRLAGSKHETTILSLAAGRQRGNIAFVQIHELYCVTR